MCSNIYPPKNVYPKLNSWLRPWSIYFKVCLLIYKTIYCNEHSFLFSTLGANKQIGPTRPDSDLSCISLRAQT